MIYCVIPRELEADLYDKMVDYYKDNPNVTVIVDRREGKDRRRESEQRLANAREEIGHVEEFDYVIINQTFDVAVVDLVSIVRAQRLKLITQLDRYSDLINGMK